MTPSQASPPAQPIGPTVKGGNKAPRGPTLPKSTTTNRIALSSGPAAAVSETRKNRKARNEEDQDAPPAQGNALLPMPAITHISVPMEAILQETPAHPIVPYQSSDQGDTPPPSQSPTS